MELKRKRYPIGIQTFSEIIEKDYLYIDKTEYVYKMTHSDSNCIFLNRPRRFGKSLLVSTLRSYFEGKKELFKGLAIDSLEKDWTKHPVIHLDMSATKKKEITALNEYLLYIVKENAERLELPFSAQSANIGLMDLIKDAKKKFGQQVVILLDEYDAPLLNVLHDEDKLEIFRDTIRDFYSPLKKFDSDIRFALITGITKFSQVSIFSELNNIKNISMQKGYAGVCGITEEEMIAQMGDGIELLAEEQDITKEEATALNLFSIHTRTSI